MDAFRQTERAVQAAPAKAGRRDSHLNSLFEQVDKLVKGEDEDQTEEDVDVVEEEPEVEPPVKARRSRKSTKAGS